MSAFQNMRDVQIATIASLTAEIERLRELIRVAHAEGWDNAVDEYSKGGLWDDCWLKSEARAALQPKEGK
jgi:hypothetical protein